MVKKKTRKRRHFTAEYKAEVVALVRNGGKTVGQVARDLDLTETSVRAWVQQADIDEGKGEERSGALTTTEREELTALRRENRTLRMERDLLRNRHGRSPTSWKRNSAGCRTSARPSWATDLWK